MGFENSSNEEKKGDTEISRRGFLRGAATAAGAVVLGGLATSKEAAAEEASVHSGAYEPFKDSFEGTLEDFCEEVSRRVATSRELRDSFLELGRMYGEPVRLEQSITDPKTRSLYEQYVREAQPIVNDGDKVKSLFTKYLDGMPLGQCVEYGIENCIKAHELKEKWNTEVMLHILGINISKEALDRK